MYSRISVVKRAIYVGLERLMLPASTYFSYKKRNIRWFRAIVASDNHVFQEKNTQYTLVKAVSVSSIHVFQKYNHPNTWAASDSYLICAAYVYIS